MNELFLKIINMSISASWLILAVLILRLVLKKAPKWMNVLLWGLAAVRLICPFSFESAWSLIPSAETIPLDIGMAATPAINSGINAINDAVNPVIGQSNIPAAGAGANPLQITIGVCEFIWISGMTALVLYAVISYWRMLRKTDTAVRFRAGIFQSENVSSPFVLGIMKPRIYLPFKMNESCLEYVIAHEQAHIRRKDHLWKPLGFLLLTIHWFNPLVWLSYILLCRDIERACDEKVIKELGNEQRADYAQALLAFSVNRRRIAAGPLAFGEAGVKERVKSIMDYRKPAFRAVILAVISCAVIATCFLTDPKKELEEMEQPVPVSGLMGLDCRYTEEITAPFFLERTYFGSIPESDASFTVAESFGYEIDDHIVDLDGDGITELVCNCQFGDGAQRVFIYRQNGSRIERGYLELEEEQLDEIMPADWSVLSIIEKYNADTGGVEVGYDSEEGWKPAAVLHLEDFTFEEYGVIPRQ